MLNAGHGLLFTLGSEIQIELNWNHYQAIMTEKKYQRYYDLAGKASSENWESVKKSTMCGCYFCRSIFPSSEIGEEDWTPDLHGRTVLCPKCSIDSVIGDASGIPIREDVLEELYQDIFDSNDFPITRTEHLLIRPVLKQDTADIFEIRGDKDTADWAGVPCIESIEEAQEYIVEHTEYGRGLSIVLGNEVIGLIETYTDRELPYDSLFLGYYMKKTHQCKGYMTEALTALRKKWTEEGEEIPMLWIIPGNVASERVAAKSGWTYLDSHVVDINCLNQYVDFYE